MGSNMADWAASGLGRLDQLGDLERPVNLEGDSLFGTDVSSGLSSWGLKSGAGND